MASGAIYTVLAIEASRGIVADLTMIVRGIHVVGYLAWIAIHATIIATGLLALRTARAAAPCRQPPLHLGIENRDPNQRRINMPKYVIERVLPGAGLLGDDEICAISEKSNSVLDDLGGDVQWLHSYVTDDKLFCVYIAPNEDRVREHATRGGFPANAVRQVVRTIDPTTGGA